MLAIAATLLAALDGPLRWLGRTIQRVRNRLRRGSAPLQRLPERLLNERDRMHRHARAALEAGAGRDHRRAGRSTTRRCSRHSPRSASIARPGLVLLAFCAAQLLAQIPVTPGGLGFVEAGLAAMLTLAGVSAGAAVLATFAYRLASYWLPLPVGLAAWAVHRRRYAG